MAVVYIETSAIVAWLLGEANEELVRTTIDKADKVVTSALSYIETLRVLQRAHHEGHIKRGHIHRLKGIFQKALNEWHVLEITPEVRKLASESFPVEPVRSLDAIHLASALVLTEVFDDLRVLSFDRRVLDNLTALGLTT